MRPLQKISCPRGNPLDQSARLSLYQVFVLRLWQEPGDTSEHCAAWRFVLEDPKTGQRRGFTDLAVLMDFLKTEMQIRDVNEKGKP